MIASWQNTFILLEYCFTFALLEFSLAVVRLNILKTKQNKTKQNNNNNYNNKINNPKWAVTLSENGNSEIKDYHIWQIY